MGGTVSSPSIFLTACCFAPGVHWISRPYSSQYSVQIFLSPLLSRLRCIPIYYTCIYIYDSLYPSIISSPNKPYRYEIWQILASTANADNLRHDFIFGDLSPRRVFIKSTLHLHGIRIHRTRERTINFLRNKTVSR